MKNKSVIEEADDVRRAVEMVQLGARMQMLEVETRLQNLGEAERSREELTAKIEQDRRSLEALYAGYGEIERNLAAAREGQTWREGKMNALEGEAREARRKIEQALRETGELTSRSGNSPSRPTR